MRVLHGSPRFEKIAQRWHDLAEQRLAYYTELYRSGRWTRYYTQESFAARMLDVIEDAKKWRQLVVRLESRQQTPRGEPLTADISGAEAAVRSAA